MLNVRAAAFVVKRSFTQREQPKTGGSVPNYPTKFIP
jgi:hypothetical protein